jgi:hypothetical protein
MASNTVEVKFNEKQIVNIQRKIDGDLRELKDKYEDKQLDLLDTIANLLRKSGQRRRACSHIDGRCSRIDGRRIEYLYDEGLTCAVCEWRVSFLHPAFMIADECRVYCPGCAGEL